MNTICPISGLPVFSPAEWDAVPVGLNYTVHFSRIGDQILLCRGSGVTRNCDLEQYYQKRDEFIRFAFSSDTMPFVEIRDFNHAHGTPTRKMRHQQREHLLAETGRLSAFVAVTSNWLLRNIIRLGLLVTPAPYPFIITQNIEDGIRQALEFVGNPESDLGVEDRVYMPEWQYRTESFSVRHELLKGHIVVASAQGYLRVKDIDPLIECYRKMLLSGYLLQPWFRVVDFSKVRGGHWKARMEWPRRISRLHEELNRIPTRSFFCGGSSAINTAIRLVSHSLGGKWQFCLTLKAALEQIGKNRQELLSVVDNTTDSRKPAQENHADELIRFIGSISWENDEVFHRRIPENHPFRLVYEAIQIVKSDIDFLLQEADLRHQQMEEQNRALENEIIRRLEVEKNLELARVKAEAANEAKSRFLANMSHELRTPLNGIIGMTTDLLDNPRSADDQDSLEIIRGAGNSLLTMIDDVLDYTKFESGRISLSQEEVAIDEFFDELLQLFVPDAQRKGIDLGLIIDRAVPQTLLFDPGRMRQVLVNLIGNALKFTEQGEVSVFIELDPVNPDTGINIEVRDTGIGIKSEKQAAIFERFVQGDDSMSRRYGGSGLGLTISRQLIEAMNGRIQVESEPGKGACFLIQLPVGDMQPFQAEIVGRVHVDCSSTLMKRGLVELLGRHGFITIEPDLDDSGIMAIFSEEMPPVPVDIPQIQLLHRGEQVASGYSLSLPVRLSALRRILNQIMEHSMTHRALLMIADPVSCRIARECLQRLGCDCQLMDSDTDRTCLISNAQDVELLISDGDDSVIRSLEDVVPELRKKTLLVRLVHDIQEKSPQDSWLELKSPLDYRDLENIIHRLSGSPSQVGGHQAGSQ